MNAERETASMDAKGSYLDIERPPKRFTAKSLHGRTRCWVLTYQDLHRFISFYANAFGWDMIEAPEETTGVPAGDPHPGLVVATGPAQYDYEGLTPGHMNLFAHWAPRGPQMMGPLMEIDMETPLEETIQRIVDHGGRLVLDTEESVVAKPLDDSKQSWQIAAVVEDPAGNLLYLWKCPASRTWDELETEYDSE
jgi:predicted enzyme related to lactoylglutathione lyase